MVCVYVYVRACVHEWHAIIAIIIIGTKIFTCVLAFAKQRFSTSKIQLVADAALQLK